MQVWFDPDACVEVPNKDFLSRFLFAPADVVSGDDDHKSELVTARTPDGTTHQMRRAQISYVQDRDELGEDDILSLNDFCRASLLHSLRLRFREDQVYTFVGGILIALNPFKWITVKGSEESIYSNRTMASYKGKLQGEMPPHLFVVADQAYSELILNSDAKRSAAIVVSGESGVYLMLYNRAPLTCTPPHSPHSLVPTMPAIEAATPRTSLVPPALPLLVWTCCSSLNSASSSSDLFVLH